MKASRLLSSLVVAVLWLGAAEAADMYTPPLYVGEGQLVACEITNISGQTRTFTFEIVAADGSISASGGNILAPGQSGGGGAASPLIRGLHYCHFDAAGQKTQWRAAIKLRTPGLSNGDLVTLPAD